MPVLNIEDKRTTLEYLYKNVVLICFNFLFIVLAANPLPEYFPDTSSLSKLLNKGKKFHYSHPDSAIFYYRMVQSGFDDFKENLDYQNLSGVELGYIEMAIMALNRTGDIYYYDDEYRRAEMYYQQSLEIANKADLKDYEGEANFDIGYIRYVNNNYSKAIDLFTKASKLYQEAGNRSGLYHAINACGLANNRLGNFEGADSCFNAALDLAIKMNDSTYIADIKIHLGILHCEQENLEEGIIYFEEALDHYNKIGNKDAVSDALVNIGVVLKLVGENERALEYFLRSTEIEELLQVKSQLVIRYYNLADLYLQMNQSDKAYEYCLKTMTVAEEIASKPFEGECNFLMGKYYLSEQNFQKATIYLSKALDDAEEINNKTLIANTSLWYANTNVQMDRFNEAIKLAEKSYFIAHELKLFSTQKEASYLLFKSHKETGDIRKALNWFEIYHNVSDSVNYYDQQKEIKRIEARYNYEKKDRENELLRNKTFLQEQRLKNRSITLFAMILGIALSIVAIILLINRIRYTRALNREQQLLSLQQLEELNKELEGKERELASKMMFLNQKNELIGRIIQQLQEIQKSPDLNYNEISSLVSELRSDAPQSNWKEFETQFVQVHPDFYKRLYEKHPDLTSYEQRICAFLRMNLNTKEIASITGRSSKSIEVTRSRIRKKLNLTRKDNLSSFLASI